VEKYGSGQGEETTKRGVGGKREREGRKKKEKGERRGVRGVAQESVRGGN